MAEYAERGKEFEDGINKVQETEKPVSMEDGTVMFLDRSTLFKEFLLAEYMKWRGKALNGALPILRKKSTSITGSDQEKAWKEYFEKQGKKHTR